MLISGALAYLRLTIGLLFVAAGLGKAFQQREFSLAIRNLSPMEGKWAVYLAPVIAAAEIGCGTLLLAGIGIFLAATLVLFLLVIFAATLAVNLARGRRDLDCQCFGRHTTGIGWGHVAQNVVLA